MMSQNRIDDIEVIDGGDVSELTSNDSPYKIHGKIRAANANASRWLAYILVFALILTVAGHYAVITWMMLNGHANVVKTQGDLFDKWLPVISGLTGSAVTYFLTKDRA